MAATRPLKRRTHKKNTRTKDTQMEFHIVLPGGADVDRFTNKLIELVESFQGTVGGGTVEPEKMK